MPDNQANTRNNQERSERIIELYSAAMELPPEDREAFIEETCTWDEALRREVEEMLAYKESAKDSAYFDIGASAIALAARQMADNQKRDASHQRIPDGIVISHYCIEAKLGEGGMGEVYLAEDTRLQRLVALKFLAKDFSADAARVRRFEREALTVSKLQHANIVTIYEHFNHDGRHVIATEYVEGETLRQVLRRGALDWREVTRISVQIAAALEAAHHAGVIHRDIKPENVMLQKSGVIKVLDFGIAKYIGQIEQTERGSSPEELEAVSIPIVNRDDQTRTGLEFYTRGYASPEQVKRDKNNEPDARTDIFSLGVLMYELLTGEWPFPGETPQDWMAALLGGEEAADVRTRCPQVPAALAAIIARALRKSRRERYGKASEIMSDLETLKNDLAVNETGEQIVTKSANRLLTQFTILSLSQPSTRIPLSKLWTTWWVTDLPRGKPENNLLRKSALSILLKFGYGVFVLVVVTAFLAYYSISQKWEGKPIRDGHMTIVRQAVFSPDGRLLLTGGDDGLFIIWDFVNRKRLTTLKIQQNWIPALAISPNGRYLVTSAENRKINVWEMTGLAAENFEIKKIAELIGQRDQIAALAFSPDGKRLASVSGSERNFDIHEGGQTIIWETAQWRNLRELKIGGGWGTQPIFLDNQRIFVRGEVWNVELGKVIDNGNQAKLEEVAAVSLDRKLGVGFMGCCYIDFWQMSPLQLLRNHLAHQFIVRAAAISHNQRWAATGAENIVFWDLKTLEPITSQKHKDNVWGLEFSPDDRWLVSTHGDGSVLVWDAQERRLVADLAAHCGNIYSVDFSPDGKRFATAGDDHSILLWNTETGLKDGALNGHKVAVKKVKFFDRKKLVSEDILGNLFLWDIDQRRFEDKCPQAGRCKDVIISPDGCWMVSTGQFINLAGNHVHLNSQSLIPGGINVGGTFSADGKWLVGIQSGTRNLFLWDVTNWKIVDRIETQEIDVIRIAFSPDGSRLALGGYKGEVALMNVHPLAPVATLGQHQNHVQAITFSPDGKLIASASDDATVGIWNVETLSLEALIPHNAPVLSVAFSPNSKQLTVGQDETVRRFTPYQSLWNWRLD